MTKRSEAILSFFRHESVRAKHNAPELLDRYTANMEVQVNVAPDGGEPVAGKRNTWCDPEDSSCTEWFHFRMPKNAGTDPVPNDWRLDFPLGRHVEAIGCTGFDFSAKCSRWFGFDFDAILGHSPGIGVSDADLENVRKAAWDIPWVEVRKSTSGSGLHLYVLCSDEGIVAANHTEHAALARAVLHLMSARVSFRFEAKVDAYGANMWVWHRKSSRENEGLKLLKAATGRLTAEDIPVDWRNHLSVILKKRSTQRVIGLPTQADDQFDHLVASRHRVPLDEEHKRIIAALSGNGFSAQYQADNHLVQVHTARLAQLANDPAFRIRGVFRTISQGTDPGTPNAFMFPLPNGGWRVYRFSSGTAEADTWDQGEGWTWCDFNVSASLSAAIDAESGHERSDGAFVFDSATRGLNALKWIGGQATLPQWAYPRQLVIKRHRSSDKLALQLAWEDGDDNAKLMAEMREHHWIREGSRGDSKKWVQVVRLPAEATEGSTDAILDRCDRVVRSVKTPDEHDAGWRILDHDGVWVERERASVKDTLAELAVPSDQRGAITSRLERRNWTHRNLPFQPRFPGNRVWNIGAQLAFVPSDADRDRVHPHWDAIFEHVGRSLDDVVRCNEWCHTNGIVSGADYLLHWAALLFQRPSQKLPYLFFFGEQETGKSSFHRALSLLMSQGHVEARNALQTIYNGELDGALLAFIEEVDLSDNAAVAYNRVKDWITGDTISINAKYATVYTAESCLHWVQVANDRRFCPVFEGDERLVMIHVADKPAEDIPWQVLKEKLKSEAPDFLRTLLDLRLPAVGHKRLFLPVLSTEAKREAIAESKDNGQASRLYDPEALEKALRLLLVDAPVGIYTGLVSEIMQRLGKGPWSENNGTFGKQLQDVLKRARERGLFSSQRRLAAGNEITIEEQFDASDVDGLQEWHQLALLAEYALTLNAKRKGNVMAPIAPGPTDSAFLMQNVEA